jgi:acetyltransferase-like isoleucine patch superfamily enzyme
MKKNIFRAAFNRVLHLLARFLPGSTTVRPFLHRLRGVKIHGDVFIGDDVYLENECPDCVEIHDGAIVGLRSMLIAHTRGEGRIVIKKDAMIGAGCILVTAKGRTLTIGEGAVIGAGSVVTRDIPDKTFCAGAKAVPLKMATIPLTLENSYEDFLAGLQPLDAHSKTT